MRVVIFTVVYQSGYGVSLVVKKHVEGLLANGFEVFLATPDASSSYVDCGLNVVKIGTDFKDVEDALASIKPDIAIVHTPPYYEHVAKADSINTVKIAFDHGEPFPFLFEGEDRLARESLDLKKYREWLPNYHLHISISEFIKRCSGFESSVVIYNGADHIVRKTKKQDTVNLKKLLDTDGFVITTLSRIGEGEARYKGFDILKSVKEKLSAVFPGGDFTFLVIGKIAGGGDTIKADLQMNGFHVISDVDEDFKQEALIQSDLFFSPSLWEGFNLPVVEAQYLGVPSMALSIGAHPEVCPFHFGTVDEAVQHIITMYKNQDYSSKCGRICEGYVKSKFTWENSVLQLVSILNNAFERSRNERFPQLKEVEVAKPRSSERAKQALENHIKRLGLEGDVDSGLAPKTYKINYSLVSSPRVSIIIPNKDNPDDLRRCITSVIEKSTYTNYDIAIIENGSTDQKVFDYYEKLKKQFANIQVLVWDKPFNYSAINNFAVKHTEGEYLLFLNNDTEVIEKSWIEEMLMLCQRGDVGAVGARLLYADGTIQHAGIILGIGGVAGHSHKYFPASSEGYAKRLSVIQNLSAVTGACLMTRRSVFNEVGGFIEDIPIAFNDVDICLRVREKGYLVIWTPYAELYHHESITRGHEDTLEKQSRFSKEIKYMREKWRHILDKDPYYSPNLTLEREDFSIKV